MKEKVIITKRTHRMLATKAKFNQIREELLECGEKDLDEHSCELLETALGTVDTTLDNMISMRVNEMAYKSKGSMV